MPALYIEVELETFIYGNAVARLSNKCAADFIVLGFEDRRNMDARLEALLERIAMAATAVLPYPRHRTQQSAFPPDKSICRGCGA